ncbi:MAG: IS66 family transposase [Planctomycetota bacterium]
MADAVSRNVPKEFRVVLANCLAHARRKFVEVVASFPEQCRHVLESLATVYRKDEAAQGMSAEERLRFHEKTAGRWWRS